MIVEPRNRRLERLGSLETPVAYALGIVSVEWRRRLIPQTPEAQMPKRKTWREKLADSKDLPRVEPITGRMSTRWGEGTMVIPAPIEVDAIMKRVPRGKLITINEIRARLAHDHGASVCCPITTGIFAWIAAHAAQEAADEGKAKITPYWRTLKLNGELNPKYPGGVESLRVKLEEEGHRVVAKGKRWFVAEHEGRLWKS
jgi:6-O-methylguanine DNA methyltransferase, DNA binding domain